MAFTNDARQVIAAGRTARLLDIATGEQVRVLPGVAEAEVTEVLPLADGRVVLGDTGGRVRIVPLAVEGLITEICGRLHRDLTEAERAAYGVEGTGPVCP